MIKSLHIQNYALIEQLDMKPSSNLNIITGETGAGKSIMLGAVGLLIGNRVDTKVLLSEDEKCVIEGVFDISQYALKNIFEEEELDYDDESVIRREITPSGKSRAFINDTPVNLNSLKVIGSHLMDVHSQHESLQLGNNTYQLSILDSFASHQNLIDEYQKAYSEYSSLLARLNELEKRAQQSELEKNYNSFMLNELRSVDLDNLNQKELEEELTQLENAEDIKLKLSQSFHILDESEISIARQIDELRAQLNTIKNFSKELEEIYERIESTSLELKDLSSEVQDIQERTDHDPSQIEKIKDQLDILYKLQKKHNLLEVNELIDLRNKLENEAESNENLDLEIKKVRSLLEESEKEMKATGNRLSDSRKLYAINLADEIEKIIGKIGIENGTIEIIIDAKEPAKDGLDLVEILFSANKGFATQKLKEVASGGEFSRLIFAIKYLIADKTALPTVIFDEIETGVSGEVAHQMIDMMKSMSKNHQVISISHLPQFAAGGDSHYFVYKDHSSERSISKIKQLNEDERIQEIAKMIGGAHPAPTAIQNARELLNR